MARTRQRKGQDAATPSASQQVEVPADLNNPAGPPYAVSRSPGDGIVPDKADQELEQARDTLAQQAQHKLELNEGGRSHDSGKTRNPPGAVHGLPTPSLHGTWR